MRVFETVMMNRGIGVSDLARKLEMPKSTIQRSLETLHAVGWIRATQQNGRRRAWEPTLRILTLSREFMAVDRVRNVALPHMRALRDETGETIHLMVPEGRHTVLVERLDSTKSLRTVRQLGSRCPLHVASNGKAVLAQLTDPEIDAYLSQPLKAWTARTKTDPAALREEIAATRRNGYAVGEGELDDGVHAVAAAVVDERGHPIGSLSISCPAVRLPASRFAEYGGLVSATAAAISADIAAQREAERTA